MEVPQYFWCSLYSTTLQNILPRLKRLMCLCVVHNNINALVVRKYLPSNVMRVHAARWRIQLLTPLVLCPESVAGTDICSRSTQTRGNGRTKSRRNRFELPQTNGWKKTSRRWKLFKIIHIFSLSEWDKIKVHFCLVPHDKDWTGLFQSVRGENT